MDVRYPFLEALAGMSRFVSAPTQSGDGRDRNRARHRVEENVLWIKHPVGYEVLYEFVDDSD